MAKLAVYKYFSFMMLVISLMVSVFIFMGLFGGNADPTHANASAMMVYALPILIIIDTVLLAYWLIRKRWHWAAIPGVVLLFSLRYIGTIYQPGIHILGNYASQHSILVATYNVERFKHETSGFRADDILSEMKRQEVDVMCLQEYSDESGDKRNSDNYRQEFSHMAKGRDDMVIYSRYPIRRSGTIDFGDTNNSAMWADINIDGKTVRLINVHLQTTGINRTKRKVAKMQQNGLDIGEWAIFKKLFENYTLGMVERAGQARQVAAEVEKSKYPVILCGDFNDVPYSYTYNTMLGELTDGFRECGQGFMTTMRGRKPARIDYIFHDDRLRGERYYTTDLSYSDHYPVFMRIGLDM